VIVEILAARPQVVEDSGGPGLSVGAPAGEAPGPIAAMVDKNNSLVPDIGGYRLLSSKRTQYDGSFLFDMVPPGSYLVRVRAGQEIRGAPLDSASQPAIVTRGQLMVDDVELQLRLPIPEVAALARPALMPVSRAQP
jgi:hypothetical protein